MPLDGGASPYRGAALVAYYIHGAGAELPPPPTGKPRDTLSAADYDAIPLTIFERKWATSIMYSHGHDPAARPHFSKIGKWYRWAWRTLVTIVGAVDHRGLFESDEDFADLVREAPLFAGINTGDPARRVALGCKLWKSGTKSPLRYAIKMFMFARLKVKYSGLGLRTRLEMKDFGFGLCTPESVASEMLHMLARGLGTILLRSIEYPAPPPPNPKNVPPQHITYEAEIIKGHCPCPKWTAHEWTYWCGCCEKFVRAQGWNRHRHYF